MSNLTRMNLVRYGAHASASDFTAAAATLKFLRPSNDVMLEAGYAAIERQYQTGNNENLASLRGLQEVAMPDISIPIEGLSGSGGGNAVSTSSLDTRCSEAIASIWGCTVVDDDGDTTTTGHSGTTIEYGGTPSFAAGAGVMMMGSSGTRQFRVIESVTANDVTIDRPLVSRAGASEEAADSTVTYAGRGFFPDNDNPNHTHLFFRGELPESERLFYGVLGSANITFPFGGIATLNLTGLQCTSWEDAAEAGTSYSAPTTGTEIICADMRLMIGSTLYQAYDFAFDLGVSVAPRSSHGAPNGHWGFVANNKQPSLTCKIRMGTMTAPAEATDALLSTWRGSQSYSSSTFDVSLQVGTEPGSSLGIRITSARPTLQRTTDNGQEILQATFTATESSQQSAIPGCARLFLF
jgi:hypothetical protein